MGVTLRDRITPPVVGDPPPFTVEETAERLNVSIGVVYRLIKRSDLGCVQVGRRFMIPQSDLNRYLLNQYKPAS